MDKEQALRDVDHEVAEVAEMGAGTRTLAAWVRGDEWAPIVWATLQNGRTTIHASLPQSYWQPLPGGYGVERRRVLHERAIALTGHASFPGRRERDDVEDALRKDVGAQP